MSKETPKTPEVTEQKTEEKKPLSPDEMRLLILQDKMQREQQMIADFQAALEKNHCEYQIIFHLNAQTEKMNSELKFFAQ